MSFFKKVIKFFILALFIVERAFYYEELRVDASIPRGEPLEQHHHQLLHGLQLNFEKINEKFNKHHILSMPLVKPGAEKLKKIIIKNLNMNDDSGNRTKHSHTHKANNDKSEEFQDKVINPDLKLNFYLLTLYDIFLASTLISFLYSDSLLDNLVLLIDSGFKVFTLGLNQLNELKLNTVFDTVYSFIVELSKKEFAAIKKDFESFIEKENMLAINIVILYLFFLLFIYLMIKKIFSGLGRRKVKMSGGTVNEEVKEEVKQVGRTNEKKEKKDTDNNLPKENFKKVEKREEQQRSRENTPSRRRREKVNL